MTPEPGVPSWYTTYKHSNTFNLHSSQSQQTGNLLRADLQNMIWTKKFWFTTEKRTSCCHHLPWDIKQQFWSLLQFHMYYTRFYDFSPEMCILPARSDRSHLISKLDSVHVQKAHCSTSGCPEAPKLFYMPTGVC